MTSVTSSSTVYVRQCTCDELPVIIDALDQEFVFNKHRSLSLSKRFPHTLSADNIDRVLVAVADGVICGSLSIRMFEWVSQKRLWPAAMIGMVWVDARHRNKGIGCSLLSSAAQLLREANVVFGVLWTGAPAFYQRAGWFLSDRGVFGKVTKCPTLERIAAVSCRPLASEDAARLESLRTSSHAVRLARKAIDYRTVPIPAADVLCFSAANSRGDGFALVGDEDGIGYLYEMNGPSCLWGTIMAAITEGFPRLFVNGCSDDPFAEWLAENELVVWQPQNMTMWHHVSADVEKDSIRGWHIPYFDRI